MRRASAAFRRKEVHPYTRYSLRAKPGRAKLPPQVVPLAFATGVAAASESKEISVLQELPSDF